MGIADNNTMTRVRDVYNILALFEAVTVVSTMDSEPAASSPTFPVVGEDACFRYLGRTVKGEVLSRDDSASTCAVSLLHGNGDTQKFELPLLCVWPCLEAEEKGMDNVTSLPLIFLLALPLISFSLSLSLPLSFSLPPSLSLSLCLYLSRSLSLTRALST